MFSLVHSHFLFPWRLWLKIYSPCFVLSFLCHCGVPSGTAGQNSLSHKLLLVMVFSNSDRKVTDVEEEGRRLCRKTLGVQYMLHDNLKNQLRMSVV